jgi:26S proteasome regulatory subunit T3
MGDVAVESPLNVVLPHKRQSPSNSIPNIDSLEGVGNDDSDEYSTMKRLQRHLECESLLLPEQATC